MLTPPRVFLYRKKEVELSPCPSFSISAGTPKEGINQPSESSANHRGPSSLPGTPSSVELGTALPVLSEVPYEGAPPLHGLGVRTRPVNLKNMLCSLSLLPSRRLSDGLDKPPWPGDLPREFYCSPMVQHVTQARRQAYDPPEVQSF